MRRIQASLKRDDGIVFRQGLVRRRRQKLLWLAGTRMKIDDLHGAGARSRGELFEDEFLGVGEFQEREVLRRRTDEDEIVVFGIIEGKQASALDTNWLMKTGQDVIQGMHREHFADSRVVIQDYSAGIPGPIVIAHTGIGPAHEG